MDVDNPVVVAEVTAAFEEYERALRRNDRNRVVAAFWASPDVVRFGTADAQRGIDSVSEWRLTQPPLPPGRQLRQTKVSTFGHGFAVVTTLFSYPGREMTGRQSQTWVHLDEGWRVVSAHVSEVVAEHGDFTSRNRCVAVPEPSDR